MDNWYVKSCFSACWTLTQITLQNLVLTSIQAVKFVQVNSTKSNKQAGVRSKASDIIDIDFKEVG